ncbi:MAG TPA: biotin/lipoyl-containing protein [bacterium]|nr:biotin/lipoyl-containing protein [bacterium]
MSAAQARRYYVRIAGQERVVELRDEGGATTVFLDGTPWSADLALLSEPSLHSLLLDGHSREMVLNKKGEMVQVSIDGETIEARVLDELARAWAEAGERTTSGASEIVAPMPGVVVALLVAAGEQVEAGRAVIVLEAMKMQNELTADASGIVDRILVKVGDSVSGGAVLVTLQAEPSP